VALPVDPLDPADLMAREGLMAPMAPVVLLGSADLMDPVALPGPVDPVALVDQAGPTDLVADEAAVRLRVPAHRQDSAVLQVQGKAGVTSGSSCWRFASASPARFRSSPYAS